MYNELHAPGRLANYSLDLPTIQEIIGYLNKLFVPKNRCETAAYAGADLVSDGDMGSTSSFVLGLSKQRSQPVFPSSLLLGLKRYPIRKSFGRCPAS